MIESLLHSGVVACEEYSDLPEEPPFPGEEALVKQAVGSRRREFVTARRCARRALADLGIPAAPILSGDRREPLWPAGIIGSITHCVGYRAAAVARAEHLVGLGIDAEPNGPLPDGIEESVTVADERKRIQELSLRCPTVSWDRLLFSAKESVYKAWYPLTGRQLGFEDADLLIDRESGTFLARILVDGARIDGGAPLREVEGRFTLARGLVLTAVTISR